MYALDCDVAIYAQGALSQTRVVRARKSENKPKVPVLSHWQRSFVAVHAAKPNISIGHPSAIGDADEVFSDHCAKNSFTYFIVLRHLQC